MNFRRSIGMNLQKAIPENCFGKIPQDFAEEIAKLCFGIFL